MSLDMALSFVNELAEKEPEVLNELVTLDAEMVAKVASMRGVELTADDVKQAGQFIKAEIEQRSRQELAEADLEAVSGGAAPAVVAAAPVALAPVASAFGIAVAVDRMTGGKVSEATGAFFRDKVFGWL
ncbi:hypothetical protein Thiowin_02601 [Thiorhodovibrio winogradskyi]|uniref:Nif11 domain-containing protein n=1 Tax=Thiorhodovibrio winogradskyi TaxID=77007 RepID=A0ABZ0SC02_9GAMM|nr:hypothetical protein [Thiorhodovibrio winogradskyi]